MEVPPLAHEEVDRTTTDGLINETEVKIPINGIDHWQGSFFYERAKKNRHSFESLALQSANNREF